MSSEGVEISSFFANPIGVVMSFVPIIAWGVAELPVGVAVIESRFGAMAGTEEVEFADKAAGVSGVGEQFRNQRWVIRPGAISVPTVVDSGRVHPGHKAGPARSADRALAVGVGEGGRLADELVDVRGLHVGIAESTDGIEALLVGTEPEDVGS